MSNHPSPRALDLRALANREQTLDGEVPLTALVRLTEGLPDVQSAGASVVRPVVWSARPEWRNDAPALTVPGSGKAGSQPQLWLNLQIKAEVPQVCQRCLGVFMEPIEVDRWFRFVSDETTAEAEDDESEEDLLVLEPRFDLLQLIEDELLMALPLVPMHPVCPQAVSLSSGDVPAAPERPNPFAALEALKRQKR